MASFSRPAMWGEGHASIFRDESVARAYKHRPEYPPELFDMLKALLPKDAEEISILDAGCGTGFIARHMLDVADRIDAIDYSQPMVDEGRRLPGGGDPRITWTCAPMETAPLQPPYSLIVAAASLHWMPWEDVLPRFADALMPSAVFAIAEPISGPIPWAADMRPVIVKYSSNQDMQGGYTNKELIEELEKRDLFVPEGEKESEFVTYHQSVDDYIASFHSRNGFSRDRSGDALSDEFDAAMRPVIEPYASDGMLKLSLSARVQWGSPCAPVRPEL